MIRSGLTGLAAALLVAVAGCSSIGPSTMDRDQLDYGSSIGDNWKNQMLANIVRIRYVDMPVFVDVGQIVAGYTLQTTVNGRVGFDDSITGGDSGGLGASGTYTDRPTITYMPKTGEAYLRSLLEPVEPRALLSLIQAGYNPEILFTWAVEAFNGVQNYSVMGAEARTADPEYYEFAGLMRDMQRAGAIGFELEEDPNTRHDILLRLPKKGLDGEIMKMSARAGEILNLDPNRDSFRVIYAPFRTDAETLTIQTRSIMQMLVAMAGFVNVPPELASRSSPGYRLEPGVSRPFSVKSSQDKPDDPFAVFRYGDYWYWIEQNDLESKRVFTLMLFLTTLTNTAATKNAPVLTIPTN